MEAIWLYVAGVSRDLPIVRKNKLSRPKTSAMMVSTRLGSGGAGPEVLVEEEDGFVARDDSDCSSRIALSRVT